MRKRGQTGTEYLIIVGFVTFAIMSILAIAFSLSNSTKDKLQMNQIESFVNQLISSAESVFFAGEPSKTTRSLYLPQSVTNVTIYEYSVLIKTDSGSGQNIRVFDSRVPLNGTIFIGEGTKKIIFEAKENFVQIDSS